MQPFWQSCIDEFKHELSSHQFNTWIKPLRFEQEGDSFVLIAPNRFVLQWVKDRLLSRIELAAEKHYARAVMIELAMEDGDDDPAPATDNNPTYDDNVIGNIANAAVRNTNSATPAHRLNSNFTFSTFVNGKANELARAAALQVAQNPGQGYNPLFVYGSTGLGKTHLVQAIGNQMLEKCLPQIFVISTLNNL